MVFSIRLIGFILVLLQLTTALHFYSHEGDTRCFYEELTKGTVVLGKLSAEVDQGNGVFAGANNLKLEITVDETFDADHRVVSQKSSAFSDFTFSALDSGEHKFCITPTYPDRNAKIRVSFNTVLASNEVIDSQRKDDVNSVRGRVDELNNKLEDIKREQQLIRERESAFRNQSEDTNTKVVRWSIIQLIVLVGTGAYQLYHLKGFFIKQKVL